MLNRKQIEEKAREFLVKDSHPISQLISITFPNDSEIEEEKDFLKEFDLASVVFSSNNLNNELIPSVFIVYVNYITGEVRMPRHM